MNIKYGFSEYVEYSNLKHQTSIRIFNKLELLYKYSCNNMQVFITFGVYHDTFKSDVHIINIQIINL